MEFLLGPFCFGVVIGWVTYRTLRRKADGVALGDIAAVIAAVGGGAITALYKNGAPFDSYAIGLAVGFFAYLLVGIAIGNLAEKREDGGAGSWMGSRDAQ